MANLRMELYTEKPFREFVKLVRNMLLMLEIQTPQFRRDRSGVLKLGLTCFGLKHLAMPQIMSLRLESNN
ncbi:hypothetical protein EH31_14305 [Erythrobacter longus]|uniref:Uncharacterized protein n=1 Tax=Erythrobacter longus TaxID=1044 RepID=A0A074M3M0_ERYLO|nr:hypothetical protein EH31_14305 [Erythrobacter longus]